MATKLHIVCFDVPYPADYGGAIDLFYKIKSLAKAGCELYIHCFAYGRPQQPELKKYCKEVWYYPRQTGWKGISFSLPYIVSSRKNNLLLQRLQQTDAPILFEGIHTTFYINHPSLRDRYKALRTHNVEHEYYTHLAKKETSFFKKWYYKAEARLLKKYENRLQHVNAFFGLSLADHAYFRQCYPAAHHTFIPPFHPYSDVTSAPGKGAYCLYHGNLSHPENKEAVLYLLRHVFVDTDISIVIAGKYPSKDIIDACNNLANCKRVSNPTEATMEDLIRNAQIHILPTFQQSGMKLKLLSALFGGRHVLVNDAMLYGTGLAAACNIANTPAEFIRCIEELLVQPFTQTQISARREQLKAYSNDHNATLLLNALPK